MDNRPCIKNAESDLFSRLSLSIPTGKVTVKAAARDQKPVLVVELTSMDYSVLVPESYQDYQVVIELVGKVAPYKKSDFICIDK